MDLVPVAILTAGLMAGAGIAHAQDMDDRAWYQEDQWYDENDPSYEGDTFQDDFYDDDFGYRDDLNAWDLGWYETGYDDLDYVDDYDMDPYDHDYYTRDWYDPYGDFGVWYDDWMYQP